MKDPKIVVTFTPNTIDVDLEEPLRITNRMIERAVIQTRKSLRGARLQDVQRSKREDEQASLQKADQELKSEKPTLEERLAKI